MKAERSDIVISLLDSQASVSVDKEPELYEKLAGHNYLFFQVQAWVDKTGYQTAYRSKHFLPDEYLSVLAGVMVEMTKVVTGFAEQEEDPPA